MNALRVSIALLIFLGSSSCATPRFGQSDLSRGDSEAKASDLLYSELHGSTVTILPAGLTFTVPEAWLANYRTALQALDARKTDKDFEDLAEDGNWLRNLCLARQEIDVVDGNAGLMKNNDGFIGINYDYERSFEYAGVLNALFNYKNCGFVGGLYPWNSRWGRSCLRVYIVPDSAESLGRRLTYVGARAVSRVIARNQVRTRIHLTEILEKPSPEVEITAGKPTHEFVRGWDKYTFKFPLWFGDFGGDAIIKVFVKQFGGHSAIFAFMGGDGPEDSDVANRIVDSVKWANPPFSGQANVAMPPPLYAIFDAPYVVIQPMGPRFQLPRAWSDYNALSVREWEARKSGGGDVNSEYKYPWARSLCLTREEIEAVENGYDFIGLHVAYPRYFEYAKILNAVFDYEYCGFAGGALPWGAPPANVQVRVYIVPGTVPEVERRLDVVGARALARTVFYNQASTEAALAMALERKPTSEEMIKYKPVREAAGAWSKNTFDFTVWYKDGGEAARLEVYLRQFGGCVAAVAFMDQNPRTVARTRYFNPDDPKIILNSFNWANPPQAL